MGEQELKALKEQIKQEILQEMSKPKQESVWKKVKKEYSEEFKKFNYINHWECLNCENKLITMDKEVLTENPISNSIGTLLRVIYKVENVSKIEADYDEVKQIVEKIVNVLNESRK